jgi:urea transport system ATP-binding protein
MLAVDKLNQYYGGSHILRDVSFTVEPGRVTTLLGRNGVGKTTLLRCLMGLVPARSGQVSWAGEELGRMAPPDRVMRGFGYVPQGREIFPRLTVEENLLVGAASRPGRAKVPEYIYELFPVLATMRRRRGGDLSGGQQQQLAIGRALMGEPALLMLDEPTEGIQPSIIEDIGRAIRKLAAGEIGPAHARGKGLAILLVEQYYDFARRLADRYVVMSRGEVVAQGAGADMDAHDVKRLIAV